MAEYLNILIIDDNEVDRKSISRALNKAKFEQALSIDGVSSRDEALVLLNKESYDIVFLDYLLSDCNGVDVLKEFQSNNIDVPTIVVTSQGDEQIALQLLAHGASDYIPKDHLTPEVLFHSIRSVFRIDRLEKEKASINQSLKQSEFRLEKVVSNADIILYSFDIDGVLRFIGGKGIDLLNEEKEALINQSYKVLYGADNETFKAIDDAFKGKKQKISIELNNYTFDVDYSPIKDENGIVTNVIGVARNVTERALMQEKLVAAKEMAEKAAKMKEQFLANMSHEIRTPMNAIIGFTDLLLYTKLNKEQKEHVNAIQISSKNLLTVINDILDFSKIEAERLVFEQVDFNIQLLLREVEKIFRPKLEEKSLNFNLVVDEELPMNLTGDPIRLNQIIWNLVGNAIKFTDKGDITFETKVLQLSKTDCLLQFKVRDTGIGMSKDSLEKIWEHFTQATLNTTRLYGGTGLGLTIAKNLVKLQKGKIEVDSVLGEWTEFTFEIPYIVSDIIIGDKSKVKKLLKKTFQKSDKYNVLVVEDNKMNQLLAKKVLQNFGYDFDITDNGKLGVEQIQKKKYDIVLMDIQMPEINGYEATEYIRNNLDDKIKNIPIIAMTAFAISGEKEKCLELGMSDYISKPFKADVLKQKIIDLVTNAKKK